MNNNQSDENNEVIKSLGHNALVTLLLNNENYHDEEIEKVEQAENSVGSDINSNKKGKNEIDIFEVNESIVDDLYDYKKNEIYFSPNNINKYSEEKFYENEIDLLHYNNMHINSSIKTELVKNNNYFKNLKKYNFLLKKNKYNTNFSIPHNFNMHNKFLASVSNSIGRFTNKSEKKLFYLPLSKKKEIGIEDSEHNELVDCSLHSNHFQIEWKNKKSEETNVSCDMCNTSETLKNKNMILNENIDNTNKERNGEAELVEKNSCNRSEHNVEDADIFYSNNISNREIIERNKCKCCSQKYINIYKDHNKNKDESKLNKKRKIEKVGSPTDNVATINDKNCFEKNKMKKKVKKKTEREVKSKSDEENQEKTIKIENDGEDKNEKPFEHFVFLDFNPKDEDYKAIKKTLAAHGLVLDLSFDTNTKKENINTKVEIINMKKCSIKKEINNNGTNLEQIVEVGDNPPKYNLLKQKKNTGKIKIVDYDFEKNICYFQ
ncbi:conserved Plasmodium protein, unknown function [Plasmodium vinckei vinckei]|uniref:Uncharacterized protein n=1 Tax=Plasmodium vinckei vinckei TaxID=54757 RepID=A0A449BT11_PLAVN|nr:conserved Plasmodium protein, unknown function [Plasmodium vinckei vinckei]KEG02377.1 hypothetical protein YYE_03116 [Plasmodium vinckei vinckei]VEV56620.1 conserved Plasmodium protein, unknown function [Plasmodium vinckei vinckei]